MKKTRKDFDDIADRPLTRKELEEMGPAMYGIEELPAAARQAVVNTYRQGRPPLEHPKKQVTVRLNPVVLEKLRATGKGWQTRLNAILEEHFGLT